MSILLIGIDDTDILGSTGTGRMARDLSDFLVAAGMGTSLGVSRHQLLVDDRIPYTSHNSSLCIGLETELSPVDFQKPAADFLLNHFREGSDPGLCICLKDEVPDSFIEFGLKAQTEVLHKKQAIELAANNGVFLVELGGTGGGIIGSLAGVGLRTEGNSGRFIDLPGIRDISGMISACDLLARTHIECVVNMNGETLDDSEMIDSRDWMRPSLYQGGPALKVRPRLAFAGDIAWTSAEIREKEKKTYKDMFGF